MLGRFFVCFVKNDPVCCGGEVEGFANVWEEVLRGLTPDDFEKDVRVDCFGLGAARVRLFLWSRLLENYREPDEGRDGFEGVDGAVLV